MLTRLLDKQPDDILTEMLHPNFQLKRFLNDNRMKGKYDWILTMTKLLEQLTKCTISRERIVMVYEQLPKTSYLEGVYEEIRKLDSITDELRYDFIQLFLKVSNKFLAMIPHLADDLTKILERIELKFGKQKSQLPVR